MKRLNTDSVDVIHLHSCSEETLRRGEVIEVLQRAKEKGKTRFIGYSGDHASARYAVETSVFDSLMTSFDIADQEAAALTLPLALDNIKRPSRKPIGLAPSLFALMSEETDKLIAERS